MATSSLLFCSTLSLSLPTSKTFFPFYLSVCPFVWPIFYSPRQLNYLNALSTSPITVVVVGIATSVLVIIGIVAF